MQYCSYDGSKRTDRAAAFSAVVLLVLAREVGFAENTASFTSFETAKSVGRRSETIPYRHSAFVRNAR